MFSVSDAGLAPATAGGHTAIDHFMLNDPAIQHTGRLPAGRRAAIVYRRHPDVLVLAGRRRNLFVGAYATDRAVARNHHFAQYRLAAVSHGTGAHCGYHVFIFERALAGR